MNPTATEDTRAPENPDSQSMSNRFLKVPSGWK